MFNYRKSFRIIVLSALFVQGIGNALSQIPATTLSWLGENHLKIIGRINQYDGQRYNLLVNQQKFQLDKGSQLQSFLGSGWEITSKVSLVAGESDAFDYTVIFKCKSGRISQSSVSVDLEAGNWSEKNYVLLPAAVYNGNRYPSRRLRYSPKLYDVKDIGIDKPIIINDVPKLSESGGVSRIQERSGSMSTPAVGFTSVVEKKGVWMLTKQGNSLGDYGIDVEENRDRSKAVISITSPVVRELYVYKICDNRIPSWDVPKDFKAGDVISITFRLYGFEALETQVLFDKFVEIRKSFAGDHSLVNALPYSACMQTIEKKFNEQNFVSKYGYYSVGLRENFLQDWQIGWTGGMMSTYPLLFAGNAQSRQNVIRNFDWLFPNGISPSGFYWDSGKEGTIWYGGDIRNPQSKNWHLVRKSGDAVWNIVKQFMLMDKMGIPVKASWKEGNQRVCDAFVSLWKKNHQLGQFVDSETGEICVGGSSSGGIVPAALALASSYYHNPEYLKTATEIADYYNLNFTQKGITCGGPGDALQNFDSESAYGLVESYVAMYEYTGEKRWLAIAENSAKQFATWVVSYNYKFPDTSAYNKLGMHTTGTVYANIQNKHTAPNICTSSGLGLLKLFRYTGNPFYIDLLKDIAHGTTQYLSHPKRSLGGMPNGYISERINMGDWEGPGTIGYILPLSTWAETSLMLTTIEIPGLYVQPDKGFYVAFDNIDVKVKSGSPQKYTLILSNPTQVEAKVSIMQEDSRYSLKVMEENALYGNMNQVQLQPGESKEITFDIN